MPVFWITRRRIRAVNFLVGPLNIALGIMFHYNQFIPYSGDIWAVLGVACGLGSIYLGFSNKKGTPLVVVGALCILFYFSRLCGVVLALIYVHHDPTPWWQYGTGIVAWTLLTVWSGEFYAMSMMYLEGKAKK